MKLRKKLLLSCAALAACATTLVSTTYAWYTTNSEVTASGMTGQATASGDSSIYIAKPLEVGETKLTWRNTVTIDTSSTTGMIPLQKLESGLVQLDGTTTANTGEYLTFDLYFRTAPTSADVDLYIKTLTITNNAADLTAFKQDNMLYTGEASTVAGVKTNEAQYACDVVKTLSMFITNEDAKTGESTANNATGVYDLDAYSTEKASIGMGTPDALAYYNAVMPTDDIVDANNAVALTTTGANKVKIATLPQTGDVEGVKVTFTIFINGWDSYAYDCCKGQGFTVNMTFTSVAADASGVAA